MAGAQGIDGALVFKVGSATPEGRGSTFYPLFVSSITAGRVLPLCPPPLQLTSSAAPPQLHPSSGDLRLLLRGSCGGAPLSGLAAPLLLPPGHPWCPFRMRELHRVRRRHCHFESREED